MLVILNIILAVVAISMLIFIHELGHFLMAKAVGMRVETFSLGFGPKLFGFQRGDTVYQLAAIPLGGYVKVTGESPDEGGGEPYEFWSKTPGQRALFVIGGVAMNFILAMVLFVVAFTIGVPFVEGRVGSVEVGSSAWKEGIQAGDLITSVNDVQNPTFEQVSREVIVGDYDWTATLPWLILAALVAFLSAIPIMSRETRGAAELPSEGEDSAGESPGRRLLRQAASVGVGIALVLVAVGIASGVQPRASHVNLVVERDGVAKDFVVTPEHDDDLGIDRIGIAPPMDLYVSDFYIPEEYETSPMQDAGFELGDRIVAIGDLRDPDYEGFAARLVDYNGQSVPITVLRGEEGSETEVELILNTQPVEFPLKGFSCVGNRIVAVAKGGGADIASLKADDVIVAVNDQPVASEVDIDDLLRACVPAEDVMFTVMRDGDEYTVHLTNDTKLSAQHARIRFMRSLQFDDGTVVTWVKDGSPAQKAGLQVGDVIQSVNGESVREWKDIRYAQRNDPEKADEFVWKRGDETMKASLLAEKMLQEDEYFLGVEWRPVERDVREGVAGAMKQGVASTFRTLGEIVSTISRMFTKDVGSKNMGGIITISRVSYIAAKQGLGKLLYMTAIISASLAFLNILPIPVLDGGHLVFLAVEKVRGRRLSEKTMAMLQTVGLVALLVLVLFVTWNDIMRLV